MEKLKFTFQWKPPTDGQPNNIPMISIVTKDDNVYLIPEEYQKVSPHKDIQTFSRFVKVKNILK